MSTRGRTRGVVEYGTDDDSSYYEEYAAYGAPPRRSASRLRIEVNEDRQRSPLRQRPYHHYSYQGAESQPGNVIVENNLNVPNARPRAASTGAPPAPNFLQPIYVQPPPRERSHERVKHYHHHHHEYSDESSDDASYRSSSRRRHRRRDSPRQDEYMSPDTARKLAEYEMLKAQRTSATAEELARLKLAAEYQKQDPDLARKLAKLELREEQRKAEQERHEHQKHNEMSSATAERLARLQQMEERKARETEEAQIMARLEEQSRRDKEKRATMLLEYEETQRKQLLEEQEALAKAEANRRQREAEAKAERDRVLASERERVAKEKADRDHFMAVERERQREEAAKEKSERERYIAAEKARANEEKAERARIIAEEKARAEQEKREAEEERKRIIFEEEQRKKKAKEEEEELRKRILAEEEEKEKKRKAKEKEEADEFNMKVKERFMKAGYSPDYIEDILEEKKTALIRRSSKRSENQLAIDAARPTYIRVQLKHLYPETLNEYGLPWDYDASDERYILIKDYISHELQQELFEHTRRIKIRREKLLITDGYVKETQTTIKPRDVYRDGKSDHMFIARRKSQSKSPGPRRSWMFT